LAWLGTDMIVHTLLVQTIFSPGVAPKVELLPIYQNYTGRTPNFFGSTRGHSPLQKLKPRCYPNTVSEFKFKL
jgi:hypothetical protein